MNLRIDFHSHSSCSYDAIITKGTIDKKIQTGQIHAIAISDHDTFDFHRRYQESYILRAQEIITEFGDIIGLFITEAIYAKRAVEVINEIKRKKGLVILPHPYRYHNKLRLPMNLIEKVDLIEVLNGRSTQSQNRLSESLALRMGKPTIAGSDAHFPGEIGKVSVELIGCSTPDIDSIKSALLQESITIRGKSVDKVTNFFNRASGKIIKRPKKLAA